MLSPDGAAALFQLLTQHLATQHEVFAALSRELLALEQTQNDVAKPPVRATPPARDGPLASDSTAGMYPLPWPGPPREASATTCLDAPGTAQCRAAKLAHNADMQRRHRQRVKDRAREAEVTIRDLERQLRGLRNVTTAGDAIATFAVYHGPARRPQWEWWPDTAVVSRDDDALTAHALLGLGLESTAQPAWCCDPRDGGHTTAPTATDWAADLAAVLKHEGKTEAGSSVGDSAAGVIVAEFEAMMVATGARVAAELMRLDAGGQLPPKAATEHLLGPILRAFARMSAAAYVAPNGPAALALSRLSAEPGGTEATVGYGAPWPCMVRAVTHLRPPLDEAQLHVMLSAFSRSMAWLRAVYAARKCRAVAASSAVGRVASGTVGAPPGSWVPAMLACDAAVAVEQLMINLEEEFEERVQKGGSLFCAFHSLQMAEMAVSVGCRTMFNADSLLASVVVAAQLGDLQASKRAPAGPGVP